MIIGFLSTSSSVPEYMYYILYIIITIFKSQKGFIEALNFSS